MKIKVDYVTNSSSSSFVVMGTYINTTNLNLKGFIDDALSEAIENTDLSYSFGAAGSWGDTDSVMIGIEYTKMKDDETLRQFKDRVIQQVKETFDIEIAPSHIEEGWEDR